MINKNNEAKVQKALYLSLVFPGLGHFFKKKIKPGLLFAFIASIQFAILSVGITNDRLRWMNGTIGELIATWTLISVLLIIWITSFFSLRKQMVSEEAGKGYWSRAGRKFMRHRKGWVGSFIVLVALWAALFAPIISPYKPLKMDLIHTITAPGVGGHPLGTDNYGRDILARLIYGARVALGIGGGATLINMVFGGLLGLVGGYFKGVIDAIIMRFLEILNSIPYIVFALLVLSVFGAGIPQIIIVLGIYGLQAARIIRSEVLSVILAVHLWGSSCRRDK